jgi:voltage-gated potassium channel
MKKIGKRVFEIVDIPAPDDKTSKIFDVFIFTLIILNVISVIFETTELGKNLLKYFQLFEVISVAIFTIEYLLRIWSCIYSLEYDKPIRGRIKFALTPMLLVDLAAIIPFYIPMLIPFDLRFLRILRLIRVFRIFKLARYVDDMKVMWNVLKDKKEELFVTLFVGALFLFISSSLVYYAEHNAQPEAFTSIPVAIGWGVCSLTEVGYANIYPVTALGKILASAIAILGVGMFALPAGILASGFMEEITKPKTKEIKCPICGETIRLDG